MMRHDLHELREIGRMKKMIMMVMMRVDMISAAEDLVLVLLVFSKIMKKKFYT